MRLYAYIAQHQCHGMLKVKKYTFMYVKKGDLAGPQSPFRWSATDSGASDHSTMISVNGNNDIVVIK
jgi:hypothetical protein